MKYFNPLFIYPLDYKHKTMTKLTLLGTTLTAFYNYPTYALLLAFLAVFIIHLINTMSKKEVVKQGQYRQVKEVLNTRPNKIKCAPMPELNSWSYQDINTLARLHKLRPTNRKKLTLINSLLQEV